MLGRAIGVFSIEVITPESLRKLRFSATHSPPAPSWLLGMVGAQHRAKLRPCRPPVPGVSGAPVGRRRVSRQRDRVHPTRGARSGGGHRAHLPRRRARGLVPAWGPLRTSPFLPLLPDVAKELVLGKGQFFRTQDAAGASALNT